MAGPARVFISYSSKDADLVDRLKTALAQAGVYVWLDHEQLTPGTPNWQVKVREGLGQATTVVYVASETAAASAYVHDEINIARDKGKTVIPFWVRDTYWHDCAPIGFGAMQYIDGRGAAYASGVVLLLAALGVAPAPAPAAPQPTPSPASAPPRAAAWSAAGRAGAQGVARHAPQRESVFGAFIAKLRTQETGAGVDAANQTQPNSQAAAPQPAPPRLYVSPLRLDAGYMLVNQTTTLTLEIANRGGGILVGRTETNIAALSVEPARFDSPLNSLKVRVDTTGLAVGPYVCHVALRTNGGDQIVQVRFVVRPADRSSMGPIVLLTAQPREIDMGQVRVGQDSSVTLTISGPTGASVAGTLKPLAPWLHLDKTNFTGSSTQVQVTARTSEIRSVGPQRGTIEAVVGLQHLYIPVRLEIVRPPLPQAPPFART